MSAREYIINFANIGPKEEEFEFHVTDSFFKKFDQSLIQNGDLDVLVVAGKRENMLLLDFTIDGFVTVACDRCLRDLELDIECYNELIVKIGDHNEELSEDVIMVSSKEHEIDVSQYIYEYISLAVPMRNVHDEIENGQRCDPEVLKELEKHLTHDKEKEEEKSTDPRWDGLKDINLN